MECKSFLPIIDKKSQVLILGSMPGEQSLKRQEYYGNEQNRFWKIVVSLFNKKDDFASYKEKKAFLIEHKVALWDVLYSCDREGSLDSAIQNEYSNDFDDLFSSYKNIKKVCFNGQKAYKSFYKHNKEIYINKKNITYITLPSTSPANARYGFADLLIKWKQILL